MEARYQNLYNRQNRDQAIDYDEELEHHVSKQRWARAKVYAILNDPHGSC